MQNAIESESQAAEAGAVGTGLRTGVTIDLSRKGIQKLPDEVVDIVKGELERSASKGSTARSDADTYTVSRLALSHNQLYHSVDHGCGNLLDHHANRRRAV